MTHRAGRARTTAGRAAARAAGRAAAVLLAIACGACGGAQCPGAASASGGAAGGEASGASAGYAWMAGTWVSRNEDGSVTEETWTLPRGTVMPGSSHTEGPDGTTRSWESLRLERRGDLVFYVALPAGAEGEIAFAATELADGRAVFENAEHDFPQRITYTLEGEGLLRATVSDMGGASQQSWLLHREAR